MKERILGLISGGIDSPLSALLASESFRVVPLHFCLYPMSSEKSAEKAFRSLEALEEFIDFEMAIIFPWAGILSEIRRHVRESFACVACRSAMLETANEIGNRYGISGMVTGESLGQKASQTLENIGATSSRVDIPVIRPLIGMNKEEITKISRDRGIWRADHAGCCLATPEKPRTKATSVEAEREMEGVDLPSLIEESSDLILEVESFDRDFGDYLFRLAGKFG